MTDERRNVQSRHRREIMIAVVVAIVGLAAIILAEDLPVRRSVADNLTTRSTDALRRADVPFDKVSFDGRDGTVTVSSMTAAQPAASVVGHVDGVRVVRVVVVGTETGGSAPPVIALIGTVGQPDRRAVNCRIVNHRTVNRSSSQHNGCICLARGSGLRCSVGSIRTGRKSHHQPQSKPRPRVIDGAQPVADGHAECAAVTIPQPSAGRQRSVSHQPST